MASLWRMAKLQMWRYLFSVYQKLHKNLHLMTSALILHRNWLASYGRNCLRSRKFGLPRPSSGFESKLQKRWYENKHTREKYRQFKMGVGTLFTITGRMNCSLSLAGRKINFILKFYLYLTMRKSDFFWFIVYVPAYYGASFRRDFVF